MSEPYIPQGQYLPPISPRRTFVRPVQPSTTQAVNPSFQTVLQQRATGQASASSSSVLATNNFQVGYTRNQGMQTNGAVDLNSGLSDAVLLPDSFPAHPASHEEIEQQIIQNMQDYHALKSNTAGRTSSSSKDPMRLPDLETARLNAAAAMGHGLPPAVTTSNGTTAPRDDFPTNQAFNTVFANNLEGPASLPAAGASGSDVITLSEEEAQQLVDLMAGQSKERNRPVSPATEGSKMEERGDTPPLTEKKQGVGGAFASFFKNLASGLSLGFYRPDNEPAPSGVERVFYPIKKLAFDAPIKSLLVGVPMGVVHTVQDAKSSKPENVDAFAAAGESEPALKRAHQRLRLDGSPHYSMNRASRTLS